MWAYATVGRNDSSLFEAIAEQSHRLATGGNTQDFSAYATVGRDDPALFKAVAAQSARLAKDGNAQALGNTLWAHAISG